MQPPPDHSATLDLAAEIVDRFARSDDALRAVALASLRWLTVEDLAGICGCSTTTIRRWHKAGHIRLFRVETEYRTTLKMWLEDERRLIGGG